MELFTTESRNDLVTWLWVAVLLFWGLATLANFFSGEWVLAELPSGIAAVLVAVPLSKGVAEGLRHFGGK